MEEWAVNLFGVRSTKWWLQSQQSTSNCWCQWNSRWQFISGRSLCFSPLKEYPPEETHPGWTICDKAIRGECGRDIPCWSKRRQIVCRCACRHHRPVRWISANRCWNDTVHALSARMRLKQVRDFVFLPKTKEGQKELNFGFESVGLWDSWKRDPCAREKKMESRVKRCSSFCVGYQQEQILVEVCFPTTQSLFK